MLRSKGNYVGVAPQALAETAPYLSTGYWYGPDGVDLLKMHATYSSMYHNQMWLATAIDKRANAIARLPMHVWDVSDPEKKIRDTTSPYALLMKNPCSTMDRFAFWRWIQSIYDLYGEAYVLKVRDDDGQVGNLLPMHPTRTAVRRDVDGRLTYIFTVGVASAGILKVDESEVIPFKLFNPDNVMRGLSKVEALRETLLNEDAIRRATESFWRRGARPATVVQTPGRLSEPAADRLRNAVDNAHGGADKMGGTLVLEEGAQAIAMQLDLEEMQYLESRKLNREEVCARYDIPPPVLHILDHATFSNITENLRSMYRDTMTPPIEDIESVLDFHLRPEFDETGDIKASFDMRKVLRGDFETRASTWVSAVAGGIAEPDEARNDLDLPALGTPVSGQLYGNQALVPLGKPPPAPPAPVVVHTQGPPPAAGEKPPVASAPVGTQPPVPVKAAKQKDQADQVYDLMRTNFPDSAIAWVKTLEWSGPDKIKLSKIDFSDASQWNASKEPDEVAEKLDKIQVGKSDPIILIKSPASDDYIIVDGHHRALAYKQLGKKALAYIADVPSVDGPWMATASSGSSQTKALDHPFDRRGFMGRVGRAMKAGTSAELKTKLVAEHKRALVAVFEQQRRDLLHGHQAKAPTVLDTSQYDDSFAGQLTDVTMASADAAGGQVAQGLDGGAYDSSELVPYVTKSSATAAKRINAQTHADLQAAVTDSSDGSSFDDSVNQVFDNATTSRADSLALTMVTAIVALAGMSAARQRGAGYKTWQTGGNPRASHAGVNGETVELGTPFSNGMNGPGDPTAGADELAGCNCSLDFSFDSGSADSAP